MAQCSGYSAYCMITGSINVERGCCLDGWPLSDPVLTSISPARPLVVVRKSPLRRWFPCSLQYKDNSCAGEFRVNRTVWSSQSIDSLRQTGSANIPATCAWGGYLLLQSSPFFLSDLTEASVPSYGIFDKMRTSPQNIQSLRKSLFKSWCTGYSSASCSE
ncbi:hypothetical protein J6590_070249 [Homalodisca vitripennis]|nr:hypothetical protein J6590_070249 [Homalodisca vitripennis]